VKYDLSKEAYPDLKMPGLAVPMKSAEISRWLVNAGKVEGNRKAAEMLVFL
jgi:hypothetical protein